MRKEDKNFDEKFKGYQNYFNNKKGIAQYLNEDQYTIMKQCLNKI